MRRNYTELLAKEILQQRQMLFISGPRQVGKTTLAKGLISNAASYINWDNPAHRQTILSGIQPTASILELDQVHESPPVLVFDELHKYKDWKNWLKGFFDLYEDHARILVTGSARMDFFRKGGDSLMGRYFHYQMHPFSLRELTAAVNTDTDIQETQAPNPETLPRLIKFGGFPEPFIKADQRFYNRWQKLRNQQLILEDIRDGTRIHEIQQLQTLADILSSQSGQITRYSTLAKQVRVSVDTIRRWVAVLESFYYCYRIRPWHRNLSKALRKDPKTYLWDWSQVKDPGARHENLIASHLLKAVDWWTDTGLGDFALYYLRTKDQKDVDFLVAKDDQPWMLVEVKTSSKHSLNKHLSWFQDKTGAKYAFQVVMDLPYTKVDCFKYTQPIKVPVESFLVQLI